MAVLENLIIQLSVDTREADKAIAKSLRENERKVKAHEKKINQMRSQMQRNFGSAGGSGGFGGGSRGFGGGSRGMGFGTSNAKGYGTRSGGSGRGLGAGGAGRGVGGFSQGKGSKGGGSSGSGSGSGGGAIGFGFSKLSGTFINAIGQQTEKLVEELKNVGDKAAQRSGIAQGFLETAGSKLFKAGGNALGQVSDATIGNLIGSFDLAFKNIGGNILNNYKEKLLAEIDDFKEDLAQSGLEGVFKELGDKINEEVDNLQNYIGKEDIVVAKSQRLKDKEKDKSQKKETARESVRIRQRETGRTFSDQRRLTDALKQQKDSNEKAINDRLQAVESLQTIASASSIDEIIDDVIPGVAKELRDLKATIQKAEEELDNISDPLEREGAQALIDEDRAVFQEQFAYHSRLIEQLKGIRDLQDEYANDQGDPDKEAEMSEGQRFALAQERDRKRQLSPQDIANDILISAIGSMDDLEARNATLDKEIKKAERNLARASQAYQAARTDFDILAPQQLPQDLVKIFDKLIGRLPSMEDIPRFVADNKTLTEQNANALYVPNLNEVIVSEQTLKNLESGELNDGQLRAIIHELVHSIDMGFGSLAGLDADRQGEILGTAATPTAKELHEYDPLHEGSLKDFIDEYDPRDRKSELNAELKAKRTSNAIKQEREQEAFFKNAGVNGKALLDKHKGALRNLEESGKTLGTIQALMDAYGLESAVDVQKLSQLSDASKDKLEFVKKALVDASAPGADTDFAALAKITAKTLKDITDITQLITNVKKDITTKFQAAKAAGVQPGSAPQPLKPKEEVPVKAETIAPPSPSASPVPVAIEGLDLGDFLQEPLKILSASDLAKEELEQPLMDLRDIANEGVDVKGAIAKAGEIEQIISAGYGEAKAAFDQGLISPSELKEFQSALNDISNVAQADLNTITSEVKAKGGNTGFGNFVSETLNEKLAQIQKSTQKFNDEVAAVDAMYSVPADTDTDGIKAQLMPKFQLKDVFARVNAKLGKEFKKLNDNTDLKDTIKNVGVNVVAGAAGFAASQHGQVAGIGGEAIATMGSRLVAEGADALLEAHVELMADKAFQSASAFDKLKMMSDKTSEILEKNQKMLGKNLAGDVIGLGVGTVGGNAINSGLANTMGMTIPGIGALPAATIGGKLSDLRDQHIQAIEDELGPVKAQLKRKGFKKQWMDFFKVSDDYLEKLDAAKKNIPIKNKIQQDKDAVSNARAEAGNQHEKDRQKLENEISFFKGLDKQVYHTERPGQKRSDYDADLFAALDIQINAKRALDDLEAQVKAKSKNFNLELIDPNSLSNLSTSELNNLNQMFDRASQNGKTLDRVLKTLDKESAQKLRDSFKEVGKSTESMGDGLNKLANDSKLANTGLGKTFNIIKDIGVSFAGLIGVFSIGDAFAELARSSVGAALEMERLQTGLAFAIGDEAESKLNGIREATDRLGISFMATAQGYKSFSSAVMGTELESQTDDIFLGFQNAIAKMGVSTQQQDSVFRALSQMASKGRVSLEELNQQLGESLPGALQAAARSMGVTSNELISMVENGDVLASELLPKLAAQLEMESAGAGIPEATAGINRLQNSVQQLKVALGQELLGGLSAGMPFLNSALKGLNNNIELIVAGGKSLAAILTVVIGGAMLRLAATSAMAALGVTSLKGVLMALPAVVAPAIAIMGKAIAAAAAFEAVYEIITGGSEEAKRATDNLTDSLERLNSVPGRKAEGEANTPKVPEAEGFLSKQVDKLINNSGIGVAFRLVKSDEKNIGKRIADAFLGRVEKSENLNGIGRNNLRKTNNSIDEGLTAASGILDKTGEQLVDAENLEYAKMKLDEYNQELDRLGILRTKAAATGDKEAAKGYADEIREVQEARSEAAKSLLGDQKVVRKSLEDLNNLKAVIEANRQYQDPGDYESQMERVNALIKEANAQLENAAEATKEVAQNFEKLAGAVSSVNAQIANQDYAREFNLQVELNEITRREISGDIDETEANELRDSAQLGSLKSLQTSQQTASNELNKILDEELTDGVKERLRIALDLNEGQSLTDAGVGSLAQTLELMGDDLGASEEKALEVAQQILDLRLKQVQTEGEILDAQNKKTETEAETDTSGLVNNVVDFNQSVEDLIRDRNRAITNFNNSVEDYYRETFRESRDLEESFGDFMRGMRNQMIETRVQIAQMARRMKATQDKLNLGANRTAGDSISNDLADMAGSIQDMLISHQESSENIALDRLDIEEQTIQVARQVRGFEEQQEDMERTRLRNLDELMIQQDDFMRNQHRQWRDVLTRWTEIEDQAKEMGVSLDKIGGEVANQGNSLVGVIHELSSRIQESIGSIPIMSENAAVSSFSTFGDDAIERAIDSTQNLTGVSNMCAQAIIDFRKALGLSTEGMTQAANSMKGVGQVMTDFSQIQPGDIIGWDKTPVHGDEHVGVYMGGDDVFHQSGGRGLRPGTYSDFDYFKNQPGAYFVRPDSDTTNPLASSANEGNSTVKKRGQSSVSTSTVASAAKKELGNISESELNNLIGMLNTISYAEGADYNTLFGGGTFTPGSSHPRQMVTSGGYTSSAAGRYQILDKTYDGVSNGLGFTPEDQDRMAIRLLKGRGALDDVLAGNFEQAIQKTNREWASLPGSPYGQPTVDMAELKGIFEAGGGNIAETVARTASMTFKPSNTTIPKPQTVNPQTGEINPSNLFVPQMGQLNISLANDLAIASQSAETVKQEFREAEEIKRQELEIQDKINELRGEVFNIEGDNTSRSRSLRNMKEETEALIQSSKGFLTINQQIAQAGREADNGVRSQLESYADTIREMTEAVKNGDDQIALITTRIEEMTRAGGDPVLIATLQDYVTAQSNALAIQEGQLQRLKEQRDLLEENRDLVRETAEARAREDAQRRVLDLGNNSQADLLDAQSQQFGLTDFESGAISAQAEMLRFLSDRSQNRLELSRQLEELQGQGFLTAEAVGEIKDNFEQLNDIQLENLKERVTEGGQIVLQLRDNFQSAVESGLSGFFKFEAGIAESLRNMALSFIKSIADMAAKSLTTQIGAAVFGGPAGGGLLANVFNFADGGEVQNFANGGLIDAMGRERAAGGIPVPIVASKGEYVLSTKNGDSQFFQALQRSGEWASMKAGKMDNYAYGGLVGSSSQPNAKGSRTSKRPAFAVNTTINVTTSDIGSFKRSEDQLRRETENKAKRAYRRFS